MPTADSTDNHYESRFIPGDLLCRDRYRVVNLLGKGSMGEVYRAEDLELGETVALKLLLETRQRDAVWMRRFRGEVKIARRVSHPHVCRVHDVTEHEGLQVLSMEYIGGEDLFRLLKRLGNQPLPKAKALEIAHQLCAGLTAIHDQGLLHRDLKPGNIMLDERGLAKITDFGIAGWMGRIANPGKGSLPYMAPEQLAEIEATASSDIYALGLVLYELFAGRRAFKRRERPPLEPPSAIEGVEIDPRIDTLILQCASERPEQRPASAREMAAALPEALPPKRSGGRFPPPEILLLPAGDERLRPAAAWTRLLALAVGLALVAFLASWTHLPRFLDSALPPPLLEAKAGETIAALSSEPAAPAPHGRAFGYSFDSARFDLLASSDPAAAVEPPAGGALNPVGFWFRQSPRPLVPLRFGTIFGSYDDPPATADGSVGVELDLAGRLRGYELRLPDAPPTATATALDRTAGGSGSSTNAPPRLPGWQPLLQAAGFTAEARRAPPARLPRHFADLRAAWLDEAGDGSVPVRLEAAALDGRISWARALPAGIDTASNDAPLTPRSVLLPGSVSRVVFNLWFIAALIGGVVLAHRHYRLKAADRRAGMRLIVYMIVASQLSYLLGSRLTLGLGELVVFRGHLAWSLFYGGLAWTLYTAVEPLLRRDWPRRIASWVRLLHGRWRDPTVGRDMLTGTLFGVGILLWGQLCFLAPAWVGRPLPPPDHLSSLALQVQRSSVSQQLEALRGVSSSLAVAIFAHVEAMIVAFFGIVGFFLLWLLLRRGWLAIGAALLLWTALINPFAGHPAQDLLAAGIACALWLVALYRVGFLTAVVAAGVAALLGAVPLTLDPTAWYAPGSAFVLIAILAAGAYGFAVSLGGQRWLPGSLRSKKEEGASAITR